MAPLFAAVALLGCLGLVTAAPKSKPNFVLIMTDDQDLHLGSMDYMPKTLKHIGEQGTFFKKHYCTMAQCCPSRVSFLTGKHGHNTNVTDVAPPYGGYTKFIAEGHNENYLPVWLQAAGYNTYYTGKLMNGHSLETYNNPYPAGWTGTDFLLDPYTYYFYNATMQQNEKPPQNYAGEYSTDLISDRTLSFIDEAAKSDQPFFIGSMPIGPHSETIFPGMEGNTLPIFNAPVPAHRHKDLFPDAIAPRSYNFNPDQESGASYVLTKPKMNQTVVDYNDYFYRCRIQSLQAIDEMVEAIVGRLEKLDLLENTYIIFTTDNGFHIGNHRLPPGKGCPYEEDVNIPFYVRGPGVSKNAVIDSPTSHTDIVPTLFELAGLPLRDDFDGQAMPVKPEMKKDAKSEHINIEFWSQHLGEGDYRGFTLSPNNTYKGLRVIAKDYDLAYMVWCTNEHELYDMKNDPGQMDNLMTIQPDRVSGYDRGLLVSRLDALMMVLKSCKGRTCTHPWESLHPSGIVKDLKGAMSPKFDEFYAEQAKVSYDACSEGYLIALEGPQEVVAYDDLHYNQW